MPVARNACHWLPVRRTKKMASMAERSGTRGLWQPSGCAGRSGSRGSMRSHNSSGNRQPSSWTNLPIRTSVPESPEIQTFPTEISSKHPWPSLRARESGRGNPLRKETSVTIPWASTMIHLLSAGASSQA